MDFRWKIFRTGTETLLSKVQVGLPWKKSYTSDQFSVPSALLSLLTQYKADPILVPISLMKKLNFDTRSSELIC